MDRVGAGDAFVGGMIYGLITYPDNDQKALEYALAASASIVPGLFLGFKPSSLAESTCFSVASFSSLLPLNKMIGCNLATASSLISCPPFPEIYFYSLAKTGRV